MAGSGHIPRLLDTQAAQVAVGTLAVLAFALMLIPGMNAFSLWLDEVNMANSAFNIPLFSLQASSAQPHLYFNLLQLWSRVAGESDLALRAFSVLTVILSAAFVYRIMVDFTRKPFAGLAAVLIYGAMGFIRYHTHQVHIRGLVLMLAMALLFFYERWWLRSSHRYVIGIILATAASLYTHYYAIYLIAALNVHALIAGVRRLKDLLRWGAIQAIAAVLFLPWVVAVLLNLGASSADAIPTEVATSYQGTSQQGGTLIFPNTFPTDLPTILGTLNSMVSNQAVIYAALIAVGLAGLVALIVQKKERPSLWPLWLLIAYLLGSLGIALILNLWIQSFMDRRVIFLLPGLAILIGYLLSTLPKPVAWPALTAAVAATFLAGWSPNLTGNWFFRQALETVRQDWQPNDAIMLQFNDTNDYAIKPFDYYLEQMFPADTPVATLGSYTLDNDFNKTYFANEVFADVVWTRDRFWVIRSGDPSLGLTSTDWVGKIEGRQFVETETIPVGWMVVSLFVARPAERPTPTDVVALPEMPPLPQTFGGIFELVDYQLNRLTAHPGETITLWLDWRALTRPDQDYAVYVHLLEGDTILHGQVDGDPTHLGRPIPTTFWATGVLIYDTHTLTIQADTLPGVYRLKVGLYSRLDDHRLSVTLSDGTVDDGLVLALIEVR